ncbi:MAG: hydrogenase nickel incorporation protein HypB [Dehalococcoidales bacterium]|nr:hydrogenase nickel incorporation protein HypB [Dehalococcoidales bacterium]
MAVKVITVGEKILGTNDAKAEENKNRLEKNGIFTINIMSSPGAGKTSLILAAIKRFSRDIRIGVVEGDVASSVDAEKVNALGIPVVQINTGGGCHLDAFMVEKGLNNLNLEEIDLLFIENVGNLICPNAYLLGEDIRLMIASMPEGDDKPYKYPAMFADSDVVILNKTDLLPYLDFSEKSFREVVTGLNPDVIIFPVSCKTGSGLTAWFTWLEGALKAKKKSKSDGKNKHS